VEGLCCLSCGSKGMQRFLLLMDWRACWGTFELDPFSKAGKEHAS
jgi:hypothetical protein